MKHSGVKLNSDVVGIGKVVARHSFYKIRLKCWLSKGEPVRWSAPWGLIRHAELLDSGETLITAVRIDREFLINGLFYGIQGMRVGGTRRLTISPHMAYGEAGVPGVVPPNAVLLSEVTVLEEISAEA